MATVERRWMRLDVNPEPWAIGPVGIARRDGKLSPFVGRNQQLDAYKSAVREAAEYEWRGPTLKTDVALRLYFWRNRAAYKTQREAEHQKHQADATNLQKATEDGLQGVVFDNDKNVRDIQSVIIDQSEYCTGKIIVCVWEIPHEEIGKHISAIPPGLLVDKEEEILEDPWANYGPSSFGDAF